MLPEGSPLCTPNFLSRLIDLGIYNFTTNLNGIKFLIKKSNTIADVENIKKMATSQPSQSSSSEQPMGDTSTQNTSVAPLESTVSDNNRVVLGLKNVTGSAGATTLTFMLKKELVMTYGSEKVLAIEIDKNDFSLFHDKGMISSTNSSIKSILDKNTDKSIIIVDLNRCPDTSFCNDIIYLIEPSTIKLNKVVRDNKVIFSKIVNDKVILNKSLLLNNDVADFEKESGLRIFYNMPPLDERKRNSIINDFLIHLGLLSDNSRSDENSNKIFG